MDPSVVPLSLAITRVAARLFKSASNATANDSADQPIRVGNAGFSLICCGGSNVGHTPHLSRWFEEAPPLTVTPGGVDGTQSSLNHFLCMVSFTAGDMKVRATDFLYLLRDGWFCW